MRHTLLPSLFILGFVAACGGKDAQQEATEKAVAAATPEPRNPHVMSFDLGHALDPKGGLIGGPAMQFTPADTMFGSIRTQYATVGAVVAARLRFGNKTLDSVDAATGKPDSMGVATVTVHFSPTKVWASGKYQFDVFLDGKFQAMKEYTVGTP